jgi:hypothetical protein
MESSRSIVARIWRRGFGNRIRLSEKDKIRAMLVAEAEYARMMADFLAQGVNSGTEAKLTIQIDGAMCEIGVSCKPAGDLMSYLVNWARAQKIVKAIQLKEYDQSEGAVVDFSYDRLYKDIWAEILAKDGRSWGGIQDDLVAADYRS